MPKILTSRAERIEELRKLLTLDSVPTLSELPKVELSIVATAAYVLGYITDGRYREELSECCQGDSFQWQRFVKQIKEFNED